MFRMGRRGWWNFVLSTTQKNYCVTRRELLAIMVFRKHFRHYLFVFDNEKYIIIHSYSRELYK